MPVPTSPGPGPHRDAWEPGSRAFFEYRRRAADPSADEAAGHRSHRWLTVLAPAGGAGSRRTYRVRHDDGLEHRAHHDELLTGPGHATGPRPPAHPSAPHPVYEVGPDGAEPWPGYHVRDYTEQDKVSPAVFGLAVRRWPQEYPPEVDTVRLDPPPVHDIPLRLVWGTQEYVYAPHVHHLATVPATVLELVEGRWHADGTFETDDHHRVAAALLRGDTHIRALVTAEPAEPVLRYTVTDVVHEVGWDNGSCHDPVGPDAVATLEQIPVTALAHWASPDPRTWREHWAICPACDRRLQGGADPQSLWDERDRCRSISGSHCEGPYLAQMLAHLRAHDGFGDLPPVVTFHRPAEPDLPVDDGHHRISMATLAGLAFVPAYLFHENGCCRHGLPDPH